jgi:hypothetical protein
MLDLSVFSRFRTTPPTIFDGEQSFGVWVRPAVLTDKLSQEDLEIVQVTTDLEGRPDKIAESLYGASELDWLVIAFCQAHEVFGWPHAGDILSLPHRRLVMGAL